MAITSRDRAQAAIALNAKLRLEGELRPKIDRIFNATTRDVVRTLNDTGRLPPDLEPEQAAALLAVLRPHYDRVGDIFDHTLSDRLPEDVAETNREAAVIAAGLAIYFNQRAPMQSNRIAATSARDARRSVRLANVESAEARRAGNPLSRREESIIAGTLLARSFRGRVTGVVIGETQAPAEAAKSQEVRVLLGDPTPITEPGAPRITFVEQEWVDQGDDRVRLKPGSGHRGTNIARVNVGDPFTVGGQQLLYPGDTSLGATPDNVANCRCDAVQDVQAVTRARRAA